MFSVAVLHEGAPSVCEDDGGVDGFEPIPGSSVSRTNNELSLLPALDIEDSEPVDRLPTLGREDLTIHFSFARACANASDDVVSTKGVAFVEPNRERTRCEAMEYEVRVFAALGLKARRGVDLSRILLELGRTTIHVRDFFFRSSARSGNDDFSPVGRLI